MVSLTDLALSGRVPLNGSSATHRVALRKAARPPGQATARGPLQCRVGPPVQLPLVQIRVNRTIKNLLFSRLSSRPTVGRWPEVCRSTLSVQLLRAQSDNSLPEACLTRERGARESRAGGPSRARALTRHIMQSEIRPTRRVQSAEGKGAAGRRISGRLRRDEVLRISHETIYQRIWADKRCGGTLFRRLRQRPKYRKRYGTHEKRGRLLGKRHISERPLSVEHRQEFGHWEMDTVIGSTTNHCILTLVERSTGCVLIAQLPARNAAAVNRRLLQLITEQPHLFRTITVDNGTEFHAYKQIEQAT